VIRPATNADAAALAALHAQAFPPAEAWGVDALALMLGMPGAFGFWQPEGGLVLARAVVDEAEILTLGVVPAARRAGLGGTLLQAAMAQAAALGARTMFLEVAAANAAARALYAAHGFTEVGLRRRYYGNGDDALMLRCTMPKLMLS
jgi:[ribosomal protein S18]-alanine N-acetyltransferase